MLKNTFFNYTRLKSIYLSSILYSNIRSTHSNQSTLSKWHLIKMNLGLTKLRYQKKNINYASQKLYAIASEYPDFEVYVNYFKLPNTYQTWFTMMGLHSWMILLRLRSEGVEGEISKLTFFRTLYDDFPKRAKVFKVNNKKKVIQYLECQIIGLMLSLDEGLLSDDCVLANAIWRNIFLQFSNESDDDLHRLERMVAYVWKQVHHLNSLPSDALLDKVNVSFLPIDGDVLNRHYAEKRIQYCFSRSDDVDYE